MEDWVERRLETTAVDIDFVKTFTNFSRGVFKKFCVFWTSKIVSVCVFAFQPTLETSLSSCLRTSSGSTCSSQWWALKYSLFKYICLCVCVLPEDKHSCVTCVPPPSAYLSDRQETEKELYKVLVDTKCVTWMIHCLTLVVLPALWHSYPPSPSILSQNWPTGDEELEEWTKKVAEEHKSRW